MTNVAFGEMWHVPLPYTMPRECAVSVVQLHSYCMGFLPEDQFAHWDQLRKGNEPNCAEWRKAMWSSLREQTVGQPNALLSLPDG